MNTDEVTRHEREYEPEPELGAAMQMLVRGAGGRFQPTLPPLRKVQSKIVMTVGCARCGMRRGLHRWGDEACPDAAWKPASGRRQWLPDSNFEPAARDPLARLAQAVIAERADMSGFTDAELRLGERSWP